MNTSVALTFFTIKQSFLLTLFTYSLTAGCGFGICYLTPLEIAMKWFPKSKGTACAIIQFGYGCGGILFNQIQTQFINPNNYSPDLPYSAEYPDELYFSKKYLDLLERVPFMFLLSAGVFTAFQLIGCLLMFETTEDTASNDSERLNEPLSSTSESINKNSLGVCYNQPNVGLELNEIFKLKSFYVITLMLLNFGHASGLVLSYYKTFGQTFIKNDSYLSIIGSVSSFFNAIGRLLWGYLVDKLPFKMCYLIQLTILFVFVSTIYLTKFMPENQIFYLIWVCAVYFTQCGIFVITPTAVAKCFGQKNFTTIYGLMFLLNVSGLAFIFVYLF